MPFSLQISNISYGAEEIAITGKLISGAYFGPEAITLHCLDGRLVNAAVTSHRMQNPEDWPVLPAHKTILTVNVRALPASTQLDESKPVIGRGTLFENSNRVDISDALGDPRFWACNFGYDLESDEVEDPCSTFWGISRNSINDYYVEEFSDRQKAGVWPYLHLDVSGGRYIEIEWAASIEYQRRIWIGGFETERRTILGYDSGHFSWPALRPEELVQILERTRQGEPDHPGAILLLKACYLEEIDQLPLELVTQLVAGLPGIKAEHASTVASIAIHNCLVPGVQWVMSPDLGWVNSWRYSQRNPQSPLSVLTPLDFQVIKHFFDNL